MRDELMAQGRGLRAQGRVNGCGPSLARICNPCDNNQARITDARQRGIF